MTQGFERLLADGFARAFEVRLIDVFDMGILARFVRHDRRHHRVSATMGMLMCLTIFQGRCRRRNGHEVPYLSITSGAPIAL